MYVVVGKCLDEEAARQREGASDRRKVRENIPWGKTRESEQRGKRENISQKTTSKPRRAEEDEREKGSAPIWPKIGEATTILFICRLGHLTAPP